jgi:hypothetical protein
VLTSVESLISTPVVPENAVSLMTCLDVKVMSPHHLHNLPALALQSNSHTRVLQLMKVIATANAKAS